MVLRNFTGQAETLRSQRKKFYQNSLEGNSDKGFHYSRMYFLFCPKGLIHSIFPPLRGKYYKKILRALCVSRERSERAVNIIFRKVPSKKWNLTFGSHMALRDIEHLRSKKNEFMSVLDTNNKMSFIKLTNSWPFRDHRCFVACSKLYISSI